MGTENQIEVVCDSKTGPEIKSIVQSLETRFMEGSKTKEENRSVIKIVIIDRLVGVSSVEISATMKQSGTLSGTFQGGPSMWITISGSTSGFTKLLFSLAEESLVGMDQSGSTFVERTQLWIAVSDWAESPWNAP